MKHRFTSAAERDLEHIYREGIRLFGAHQASAYFTKLQIAARHIAEFPYANRVRSIDMGEVRLHRSNAHLIVYCIEDDGAGEQIVSILRIRHAREDWRDD